MPRTPSRNLSALVAAFGLIRLLAGWRLGFRPFDDTYITFRYALNLGSGLGFVYNDGERVLGTTTPLWTMVLALLQLSGIPLETGALVISLSADVVSALLIRRLLSRLGYSSAIALAAPILFLSIFDYFSLARSGMETSCFVCLTIATLDAIGQRQLGRAATLCGLACLARPEGVFLVGILVLQLWRHRRVLTPNGLLRPLGALLLVTGVWTAYAVHTFGSPIPQSIVAKASMSRDPGLLWFSWANLALFFLKGQYGGELYSRTYWQMMPLLALLTVAALGGMGVRLWTRRGDDVERFVLLALFPSAYVGALAVTHAFTFFPWYYGPIYPFLAILAVIGAAELLPSRQAAIVAAVCVVLIAGQATAAVVVKMPMDRSFWIEGYQRVSEGIPRDRRVIVAAFEIGTVGWRVWPSRVLDLVGLVTPDAVGKRPERLIAERKPDYLVLRTDDAAAPLRQLAGELWFQQEYVAVAVAVDPYVAREFRAYRRIGPVSASGDPPAQARPDLLEAGSVERRLRDHGRLVLRLERP